MVRSGLQDFIAASSGWRRWARRGTGEPWSTRTEEVDVVLMDMVMPVMDGSEATRRIMALGKPIRVIALTSFHEQDLVKHALQPAHKVPAQECQPKTGGGDPAAYGGRATLAPEATAALIDATRQQPDIGFDLTEREREVLILLCRGYPTRRSRTASASVCLP